MKWSRFEPMGTYIRIPSLSCVYFPINQNYISVYLPPPPSPTPHHPLQPPVTCSRKKRTEGFAVSAVWGGGRHTVKLHLHNVFEWQNTLRGQERDK
jgi:hypothetical protein